MPLPDPIIVDLFDIEYRASRVALDHLADVIENAGFSVTNIEDFDIKVWVSFTSSLDQSLCGEFIVDRMLRKFEISAKDDYVVYTAVSTRDFNTIEDFLRLLSADLVKRGF